MAKRNSRLEKERLEAALEELCGDQPEESAAMDSNIAGLTSLSEKVDDPEPSGLRAPCVTGVLTAQELAALADEDDEVDVADKVVIDNRNHGVIDQVDAKLVTELNKKLSEEAAHASEKPSAGFSSDLSAALERKLGGQESVEAQSHGTIDAINNDLIAAVERKLGHATTSGELEKDDVINVSGLRAPQSTVKLSAEALASLDDEDDEVEDRNRTNPVPETHGTIDNINDKLVLELQRKLASAGEENEETCEAAECAEPEPVGFRAPQNTVMLTADMINALDDDEEDAPNHGAIDGIDSKLVSELQQRLEADADDPVVDSAPVRGCRAPQPTMKLSQDMLQGLDVDEEEETTVAPPPTTTNALAQAAAKVAAVQDAAEKRSSGLFDPTFAAELHHQLAAKSEDHSGLHAPQPTQLITADMLADLDDEQETTGNMLNDAVAALQELPGREVSDASLPSFQGQRQHDTKQKPKGSQRPKASVSFRNSNELDMEFAANLAKRLSQGMSEMQESEGDGVVPVGTRAPPGTTTLSDSALAEVFGGDEEEADHKFDRGRIAPQCTQVLSNELLAEVESDDDGANLVTLEGPEVVMSGMKAPQCTAVFSIDQLAQLDEDNEQQPQKQVDTILNGAPATVESDFAAKVIQNMRDLPNCNSKPLSSSCKLRLAWLSDDEVRKENDALRREIATLRAQIDMHRKEACFARK